MEKKSCVDVYMELLSIGTLEFLGFLTGKI